MTYDDYSKLPGVNWSTLKEMRRSPAHYQLAMRRPRETTPAMRLGSAVDCAVLTPRQFESRYAIYEGTRRGKAWEQFESESLAAGRDVLTASEAADVLAMKRAVEASPIAQELLVRMSAQTPIQGELRGIQCKGLLDAVRPGRIADLKTAKDGSPEGFSRQAWALGYFGQAAFYSDLVGQPVEFHFLVVEKETYQVSVYRVGEECMRAGREQYTQCLDRLALCLKTNDWPGYSDREMMLQLPKWANAEMGLEDS